MTTFWFLRDGNRTCDHHHRRECDGVTLKQRPGSDDAALMSAIPSSKNPLQHSQDGYHEYCLLQKFSSTKVSRPLAFFNFSQCGCGRGGRQGCLPGVFHDLCCSLVPTAVPLAWQGCHSLAVLHCIGSTASQSPLPSIPLCLAGRAGGKGGVSTLGPGAAGGEGWGRGGARAKS